VFTNKRRETETNAACYPEHLTPGMEHLTLGMEHLTNKRHETASKRPKMFKFSQLEALLGQNHQKPAFSTVFGVWPPYFSLLIC
jgi:hypothetical protein